MITTPRPGRFADLPLMPYIKGHIVTIRHFIQNLLNRRRIPVARMEYPEVRREYSTRFRGRHWLRTREDGSVACVACFMCSTNCPATCIRIEAGEKEGLPQEKYPTEFEIDLLRCVYCGYCVDACPCNVIYMTRDDELSTTTRAESIITLKELVEFPEKVKGEKLGYKPFEGVRPEWKKIDRMKY